MLNVLKRTPPSPRALVPRMKVSLVQRIGALRERLVRDGRISFRDVMAECQTRTDVIVSFLAVLEMLKGGECDARQDALWGDIEIVPAAMAAG
jgi:segregation and condensation protein A